MSKRRRTVAKILVVEDDLEMAESVKDWLTFNNYNVEVISDGAEAFEYLRSFSYDLIVLDIDLPNLSGYEICSRLRTQANRTPIIMLTGRNGLSDKIVGFNAGSDDYLTKPFDLEELTVRIRALLNRAAASPGSSILTAGHISLDSSNHRVFVFGKEIKLPPLEFDLLEFLLRHQGTVYSPEALLNSVWSSNSDRSPATVRTCVQKLRDKLKAHGVSDVIKNVHGTGYFFEL